MINMNSPDFHFTVACGSRLAFVIIRKRKLLQFVEKLKGKIINQTLRDADSHT